MLNVTLLKQPRNQVKNQMLGTIIVHLRLTMRFRVLQGISDPLMKPSTSSFPVTITAAMQLCWLWRPCSASPAVSAQAQEDEFGPVVSAYLGYLRNEQEVVDDRASRREVSPAYYRHNSNRIRALRQVAIRIARETQNDYLPELEAVSKDELRLLFEQPPRIETLKVDEVFGYTFRFLGSVRSGETFYVFARLDPYEQAELLEKGTKSANPPEGARPWREGLGPVAAV